MIKMAMNSGLEGVVAAQTELSLVDGQQGILVYRGHLAKDLAQNCTFEEVAFLLWHGHLPSKVELAQFTTSFAKARILPEYVRKIIDNIPAQADMMSVLRTAISAVGTGSHWPPTVDEAMRLTALVPTVIGYREARLRGEHPVEPNAKLSHVENYLTMLNKGNRPSPEHVKALEAYLIITMEHGMNASTFTARVITSTESDMTSAITGAIGAMKGPLHGGAPSEVMNMLTEIGSPENAESWLRAELEAGHLLMGFGHRVYKTRDPRAMALQEVVAAQSQGDPWFQLSVHVEDTAVRLLEEYKPGRKLYANVEYWAAAILRTVGIPKHLYTPTFTASRMVGWSANILEQSANNRLIRPQSEYVGPDWTNTTLK
jgi:citrate synthase